ncbi:MAG: MFS transporter [Chloroflexi bacterium]|nr:MFS transporter [Chloroflexota bacterium]
MTFRRLVPRSGLWQHRDFLKLWSAETISLFGTQVTFLALPFVAIAILSASPFEVALLATVEFLPFILFSLPAGVWVDRLPRRPILIVGDLGRAAALASIPVAHLAGLLTIYQLYAVAFINGVLTVFFDVAYMSYLPALVDRDELVEGNAKLEVSRSSAQIGGPGIGGILIGLVSAPIAVVVDALSFVASAIFIFLIRRREPPVKQAAREPTTRSEPMSGMRSEIAVGLRYVFGHRYLRSIAACTATANFFGNIVFSIFLVYLLRDLELRPELVGLIFAIGNIGFLVGALVASRTSARLGVGPTIVASALLFGPPMLLIPLAPRDFPAPLLIASGLFAGLANVVYNVTQVSFRQAITPERMQGRMNATMRFIVWGTIPLGQVLGGVLATTIGLLPTIWIGAIGSCFAFLPVLLSPVRSLQEMPEPVDDDEPPTAPDTVHPDADGVIRGPAGGQLPTPDES